VIEPSLGADRVVLAFLCAAYDEENIGTEEKPDMRTVLHFHPALAPVKIGVLPLSKKLNEGAEKVYAQLAKKYNCEFDDREKATTFLLLFAYFLCTFHNLKFYSILWNSYHSNFFAKYASRSSKAT